MAFWKTQSFKTLQKQWYKLLESEGFQDAERLIESDLVLKQTAHRSYRGANELERETKETYFNILAQKIQVSIFRCEVHRLILTWHADGMNACAISRELTEIGEYRNRNSIRYIIRKYEMAWGIRDYTQRQLNRQPRRT